MKVTFIETAEFKASIKKHIDDAGLRELQNELLKNPKKGDVQKQGGGIRKLRFSSQATGKGKRGGVRVIYLHVSETAKIYLLACFGKNEKSTLTPLDLKILSQAAKQLKGE